MNLFQMAVMCEGDILTIVSAIKFVFTLIQWAIPLALIVLGTIDMFKAMTSGDEKKTKEAQKTFIRRLIYAVVAFLIPFIISLVFTFVGKMIADDAAQTGKSTYDNFFACWRAAGSENNNSNNNNNNSGACYMISGGQESVISGVNKDTCAEIQGAYWK